MQDNQGIQLILGMAVVTYLPRLLPMLFFNPEKLPPFANRFLGFIPYAVLSALIFSEILTSTSSPSSALVGGVVALVLAVYDKNLFFVVVGGIVGVFICELML